MTKWSRSSIKSFLNTDRGTLLLCMVLAFIFWLFTKMANTYETDIVVQVSYKLPQGKTLTSSPPSTIEAKLSGGGWKLLGQALQSQRPRVSFSLNDNVNQVISPRMQESIIEKALRNDYQIVSKSLENITVQLDNLDTLKIPIRINQEYKLAPQHQLRDSIQVNPDSVWVIGPESLIRSLPEWYTDPISKQVIDSDLSVQVPVKAHLNSQIQFQPRFIQVDLDVDQFTEKQIQVPVTLVNVPDSLMVDPNQREVSIRFVVGLSDYEQISTQDFRVIADFTDFNWQEETTVPVEIVSAPSMLRNIEANPKAIAFFRIKKNQ